MNEKIILIIGKADSGKTTKAKEISCSYDKENVVWIDGYQFKKRFHSNFYYKSCNLNTELIIIDGIKDASHIESFYSYIYEGIRVEKKYKEPFLINPKIIIVCSEEISMDDLPIESLAFNRRFLIINCDYERRKI
jgi:hypothetical protein